MHKKSLSANRLLLRIAVGSAAFVLAIACAPTVTAYAQATMAPVKTASGPQEGRGVSSPRGTLTAIPDDFSNLKLTPGFLLNVEVYGEPELSGHVRIDNEGNISFPFLGVLHVAGDSMPEAQKKIQQRFVEQEILTNPQVTLNVEQFAATGVMVLGEVQSPGRIELLAPHTLLDVIAMAGGETAMAGKVVEVKHADASAGKANSTYEYSRSSSGESIRDVMVRPGDTVMIKRAGVVYVLGAVNRPGGYVMQEDGELNVAQAISLAQGLAMQAQTGALRVVKHGPDGQLKEVPVSYKEMMNGKAIPLKLEAEDIVYVPVSKVKAMFSTGSSIIGQATSATIYAVK